MSIISISAGKLQKLHLNHKNKINKHLKQPRKLRAQACNVNVSGCGFHPHTRKWNILWRRGKPRRWSPPLNTRCLKNLAENRDYLNTKFSLSTMVCDRYSVMLAEYMDYHARRLLFGSDRSYIHTYLYS